MQEPNLDETTHTPIDATQPAHIGKEPQRRPKRIWVRLIVVGWILIFLSAAVGGYGGYKKGINDRLNLRATELVDEVEQQYQLGLQDYEAGEYDRARQRFEYVIEQNPGHTRAIEMLARTISIIQATATPTPVTPTPTPTLTPTPDLRGEEELFSQAQTFMGSEDWTAAIDTLLLLRKNNPEYQAIKVDSMLYVALRNRGVEKILQLGELEEGLYDLGQAEQFGPIDAEALGYSNWARFYIIGASFWEVDWSQAAYYFGQVAPYAPNLQDATGWLAIDRYRTALQHYVEILIDSKDWCKAEEQLKILMSLDSNPDLKPTATKTHNKCSPPTPRPQPQPTGTPTATQEGLPPTQTPTPEPAGTSYP